MDRRFFLLTLSLAACGIESGSVVRNVNTGPLPADCTKIEGSFGQPQTVTAGGVTVEITGWIHKDGEPGEYIGFTYTTDGPADITIKAGEEIFVEDGDGTWIHPAGTLGSDAHAISNIVFCKGEEEPPPPCVDETDPCNGTQEPPPVPEPEPAPPDQTCTSHEECESGICLNGTCVSI